MRCVVSRGRTGLARVATPSRFACRCCSSDPTYLCACVVALTSDLVSRGRRGAPRGPRRRRRGAALHRVPLRADTRKGKRYSHL